MAPMSTLDAVVSALDFVIEWSIAATSRLGFSLRCISGLRSPSVLR